MTSDSEYTIECPCCGCEAWIGTADTEIVDGTPLLCGCRGHLSCDSETEAYAVADDCDCQEREPLTPLTCACGSPWPQRRAV